jgi:hypothetical protein
VYGTGRRQGQPDAVLSAGPGGQVLQQPAAQLPAAPAWVHDHARESVPVVVSPRHESSAAATTTSASRTTRARMSVPGRSNHAAWPAAHGFERGQVVGPCPGE